MHGMHVSDARPQQLVVTIDAQVQRVNLQCAQSADFQRIGATVREAVRPGARRASLALI
jgi:hypothetical protein